MEKTMSLPEGSPWRHYEMLQRLSAKSTACDTRDYAIDAALQHILDNSTAIAPAQPAEADLTRIQATAARRHRYRARLSRIYQPLMTRSDACGEEAAALRILVRRAARPQLQLVCEAATGATDNEMALARGLTAGALRVRLMRARRAVLLAVAV
jgi:hypothetical protein